MRGWPDHRVERLKTLWNEGWSASKIAQDLGGVSRSAVCGQVHRLGLGRAAASRPTRPVTTPGQEIATAPPRPRLVAEFVPPASQPLPADLGLADAGLNARPWDTRAKGECSWPIDGPGGFLLACCDPTEATYCSAHAKVAYQPTGPRRKMGRAFVRSVERSIRA